MYQSLREVQLAFENGEKLEYLFFWGHRATKGGTISKSCLSQWWACTFEVEGTTYSSAEQYMMAEKARLFGDEPIRQEILKIQDPNKIKSLGRKVKNFDLDLWNEKCQMIVYQGNLAKFSQNPKLKNFLLATGDKILVEASPFDTIWGIGLGEKSELALNPMEWRGTNYLGFALIRVREALKNI